jgi:hypothetical protein
MIYRELPPAPGPITVEFFDHFSESASVRELAVALAKLQTASQE